MTSSPESRRRGTVFVEATGSRRGRLPGAPGADNGRISWISPIARAILKAQEGDVVELRTPNDGEPIEVVKIRYSDREAP